MIPCFSSSSIRISAAEKMRLNQEDWQAAQVDRRAGLVARMRDDLEGSFHSGFPPMTNHRRSIYRTDNDLSVIGNRQGKCDIRLSKEQAVFRFCSANGTAPSNSPCFRMI